MIRETIPPALAGERVDRVVALLADRSRAAVAALVAEGAVCIDGEVVSTRSRRVVEGELIEIVLDEEPTDTPIEPDPTVGVTVRYEDDHLVVIDKPPGLVVHPGSGHQHGTLVHGLLARYPEMADVGQRDRPGIVHRLDRGTSGLLVVARTAMAYEDLVAQLQARSVTRTYRALVWGSVEADEGLVDAPIGRSRRAPTKMAVRTSGREARTRYRVLDRYSDPVEVTLLECALETGRTHQIRVHLAAIGHPVVGDQAYGGARGSFPLDRPFLHASVIELRHPVTGEAVRVTSELPVDLEEALARLAHRPNGS